MQRSRTFSAKIEIIGVNPYVLLPLAVLETIFQQANKNKGPVPVKGTIDGFPFIQTLVKFRGTWRLYLNTPMRTATKTKVGDTVKFTLAFDPAPREVLMHRKLKKALKNNPDAKAVFESLRPSLQKGILKYINFLKTEESVDRNVEKTILSLTGKQKFIGRDSLKK